MEALLGIEHICEAEEIQLVRASAMVEDEQAVRLAGGGTFPMDESHARIVDRAPKPLDSPTERAFRRLEG